MKKHFNATHGDSNTRFYTIYKTIKQRCEYHKHNRYEIYGGRGISFDWKSYEEFKDDMYDSYKKHIERYGENNTSIERIDNDGNYCKDNCKWATPKEQARNRSSNHLITFRGETKLLVEWAEELDMAYNSLHNRINKLNWSIKKALTKPVQKTERKITHNGKTQSMKEWADELGMAYSTLSNRINKSNWPTEKALTTPVN